MTRPVADLRPHPTNAVLGVAEALSVDGKAAMHALDVISSRFARVLKPSL